MTVLGAIHDITVRVEDTGGPVRDAVDPPSLPVPASGHAIILIHGFNNDREDAGESYRTLVRGLKRQAGQPGVSLPGGTHDVNRFYWPGDADLWFFSFLSYPTEIVDAQQSAERLASFLSNACADGLQAITLIGHSLGCRLILEMIDLAERRSLTPFPTIHAIALAAAAVPVQLVESGARLRPPADIPILVMYSPSDLVLDVAFPLGQSLALVMGYEDETYQFAVGLDGQPSSFGSTRKQLFGAGHGDYWSRPEFAREILAVMGAQLPHELPDYAMPSHGIAEFGETAPHDLPQYTDLDE